jgi:hypothetical protein
MKSKPNQKIQLDASKLVGFSKAEKAAQKADSKLKPKVGGKTGRKPIT